jgi:molecular chaperone DnaK
LRELGDKVPANERSNIESKVSELKAAAQTDDLARIKKATEEVQQAFYALSQQLYAQGQPQGQPEGGPSGQQPGGSDGDVIEGEVKE